ncbi:MAG: hypothetical protein IIV75_00380, partial [Lachnospiraceae bacterium]|nr:hypothetical protein [Lachnospiraceae bacterium]
IHILLAIGILSNFGVFKKICRVTASAVISINHSGSMGFAKEKCIIKEVIFLQHILHLSCQLSRKNVVISVCFE